MKKFIRLISLIAIILATKTTYAGSSERVVGPTLSGRQVAVCIYNEHQENNSCFTGNLPLSEKMRITLIPTKPIQYSTASWYAIGENSVLFCGMNVPKKLLACAEIGGLSENLDSASKMTRQRLIDVFDGSVPQIKSAVRKVTKNLAKAQKSKADVVLSLQSFGEFDDIEDCSNCDGDDLGGGGGDGEIPVVEVPGNSGDGGGNWGGWIGSGPSVEPPGAGPTESPERARCTSSAYVAWLLMEAVCLREKGEEFRRCKEYSMREYETSLKLCREIP